MATAIAINGTTTGRTNGFARPKTAARTFVKKETKAARIKRFAIRAFVFSAILSVFTLAGVFYLYKQYAAIVDKRVEAGFWQSRAGIYTGSIKVKRGQQVSPERLAMLLGRGGYVEGNNADGVFNGTFKREGNTISISTKDFKSLQDKNVTVTFVGETVSNIVENSNNKSLDSYELQSEMLTDRTEARRGKNEVLKFQDIPETMRQAILVAEDQKFFEHFGLDLGGIARAFYTNLKEGKTKQGGSTITQQFVKNTFLSLEKSYSRKFSEALIAVALEQRMSKEDIFTLYANEIYLGQQGSKGIHGIREAAQSYFGKELKDLNLTEAAAIAAMIKNPNKFAPNKNSEEAETRRNFIIGKMAEIGFISTENARIALKTELKVIEEKNKGNSIAPYFVDSVVNELNTRFSTDYLNTNFNNRVYTTVDTQLQRLAEEAVAKQMAKLDGKIGKIGQKLEAAVVSIDPKTGNVLAMVGGRNYAESQFNRAAEAMRQPGSTFKPFVYATALEQGKTPLNVYADEPTKFPLDGKRFYEPANFGKSYTMKNLSLKTALAKSSNIVAVKTGYDVGFAAIANRAKSFGFENVQSNPAMVLGTNEVTPLQLAAAYAAFANGGKKVTPTFIEKIIDGDDKIIYQSRPSERQIISAQNAFIMTDMMRAVVERGTARSANKALGANVVFAGKTGSSNDGWFVGYTPNLVTVVWVGFDETADIKATGGEVALPLWVEFMKSVVEQRPEFGGRTFEMPEGLKTITIDPETGMQAGKFCPLSETVVVRANSVPNVECFTHRPQIENFATENIQTEQISEYHIPETANVEFSNSETAKLPNEKSVSNINKQTETPKKSPAQPIKETILNESMSEPEAKENLKSDSMQTNEISSETKNKDEKSNFPID